jgi:hypothetical protein
MNEEFLRSTLELNIEFFREAVEIETNKYNDVVNQLKELPIDCQGRLMPPLMTKNFPPYIELLKTLEQSNRVALSRLGIDEVNSFDG